MNIQNNISQPIEIELLAPAMNADIAIEAIRHGADAVYIGPPSHGARKMAMNSIEDIKRVVKYAHTFGAKVYSTVNTIIYDTEMPQVVNLVWQLYAAGVDALIVQDLGLLAQHLPPIALHASTQCDIRTSQKAAFLQSLGFTQLVLPREFTINEIREIRASTTVPLEAFVHGALCVSYSGDCQVSYVSTGRSANRGECSQICRYCFNLEDSKGNVIIQNKHLLSLRDLNRLENLEDMLEAGVSSFKIEGRLKDVDYVKNVVAAYSTRLDQIIASQPGKWKRSARGKVHYNFTPDVELSFNRGFTSYFLRKPTEQLKMASADTPKFIGQEIGSIKKIVSTNSFEINSNVAISNGDGLGFFMSDGKYTGFRVNRVSGNRITTLEAVAGLSKGVTLFRNANKKWNDLLTKQNTAKRQIEITATLQAIGTRAISLRFSDNDSVFAEATRILQLDKAQTPQQANRRRIIEKLGDTPFVLKVFDDKLGELFVASSILTDLRREVVNALIHTYHSIHNYKRKIPANPIKHTLQNSTQITRHDNIANHWAEQLYKDTAAPSVGVNPIENLPHAIEIETPKDTQQLRVMQTRYCLRRELGACLETSGHSKLPSQLYLTSGKLRLSLEVDCKNCRMNIYTQNKGCK